MEKEHKCNFIHGGLVIVYKRPLRRLFRKTFIIVCCRCGMEIEEP